MSSLIVPIAEIKEIVPHPNADKLEIAIIGDWPVIVGKGSYTAGDRVVYVPIDTVIPERWSDAWGVTQYLSNGRVRCAKLRGAPSFGFTVPVSDLPRGGALYETGENVAHVFEITKYEPKPKGEPGFPSGPANGLPSHPLFPKYTDIENMRHYPTVIEDGEEVVMTEKIHGTNTRVGMIEGELMVGTRNHRIKLPEDLETSWYGFPLTIPGVKDMFEMLVDEHGGQPKQAILYGEVYGRVQSLHYGEEKLAYRAFDLLINGKYVSYDNFLATCQMFNIPTAPELYRGPFTIGKAREMSEGDTTIGGDHIREGVVVKPTVEQWHPMVGRTILKYVNAQYLLSGKDEPVEEEVTA